MKTRVLQVVQHEHGLAGAIQTGVAMSGSPALLFTVDLARSVANWQLLAHQKMLLAKSINRLIPLHPAGRVFVDVYAI